MLEAICLRVHAPSLLPHVHASAFQRNEQPKRGEGGLCQQDFMDLSCNKNKTLVPIIMIDEYIFHFPPESAIAQNQRWKTEDCQNQETLQDECVNRVHRSGDFKYKVNLPQNNFEFVCLHGNIVVSTWKVHGVWGWKWPGSRTASTRSQAALSSWKVTLILPSSCSRGTNKHSLSLFFYFQNYIFSDVFWTCDDSAGLSKIHWSCLNPLRRASR